MNEILERLDKIAPPPREVLTIDEVASVLDTAPGTLRNMRGRMPFPVLKIGGNVRVSKVTLAKFLAGQTDSLQNDTAKPEKRKRGRPLNSLGLQRYAARLLTEAFERIDRRRAEERAELESVLEGRTFPDRKPISI